MVARVHARVERVLAFVAGTALFIMMVLTFVDVTGRYGFNASVFGAAEMIGILMTATIFAGVAFVTAANEHITVTIFEAPVRRLAPGLHRRGILLFSLVVHAALTRELWVHMIDSLASGKRTAVLDLPQWIVPGMAAGHGGRTDDPGGGL